MSKLSFQYGFSVFFMTLVVRVCSPFMVATAKGSGNPEKWSIAGRWAVGGGRLTEDIAFVQAIGGDDCKTGQLRELWHAAG